MIAAIAVTGLALGIAILGDLGSLFSTDFGRVLLVKVALEVITFLAVVAATAALVGSSST